VTTPTFITSAAEPRGFPADDGREVAFVGRSNSGKSTALNAIAGVRALARVSKTPGRTQLVNFFALGEGRRLVDLPGYGFARVEPAVKDRWRGLIEAYFTSRVSLAGTVVTVDVRRGLTPLDEQMLAWLAPRGLPVLVLLTKADKLGRGAARAAALAVAKAVGAAVSVQVFSAKSAEGVAEARAWLAERLS
jgi:GTP-binding protein